MVLSHSTPNHLDSLAKELWILWLTWKGAGV